jgi:glycosyltransferase involved in cell wall biosynthesis
MPEAAPPARVEGRDDVHSTSPEPLVKVIVPCYGYADLLEGCVRSVLRQEGIAVRVLIIDDCSPDETPAVARRLERQDERVEYRRNADNMGLIATANEGLAWADDSDYVVLLSADDRLVPGALGRAAAVFESHPGVGLVYGHAQYFESDDVPPRIRTRWRGTRVQSGHDWIRLRCRSGHGCISSPEAVVRTSVQRAVGFYDPACQHTSDAHLWMRIAAVADIGYVRGATQALYRIHADSMLRSMLGAEGGQVVDLVERRTGFELFFSGPGAALPEAAEMRALAERTLARQALWKASRAYDRGEVEGPGAVPVEALIDFALETCADARRLREWRGLRLRQRIGAGRSRYFPLFLATGLAHRLRIDYGHRRLHRRGL